MSGLKMQRLIKKNMKRCIKNQWKNALNVQQIARLENKFRDFINKFSYD